jgi:thiol-disulfide isomerase/thioredoxin
MRRRFVLLTLVAATLTGCSTGKDAVNENAGSDNRYVAGDGKTIVYPVADRKPAPAVSGKTLDDGTLDLATRRGHVVVLNFWASWCQPCRLESADLEAVHQSTKDSGVDFVGVDSRDEKDAAVSFVAGRVTYPSLFDPAGRIALHFADVPPTTLPSTLIIDRSGKVAVVIRNAVRRADLARLVAQIGAES